MKTLFIHSIFQSFEGEVSPYGQGIPSLFLRLAGCNLSCSYCDIPEAQKVESGIERTISDTMKLLLESGCRKLTITGGEPLLQAESLHYLLWELFKEGFKVNIETNGTVFPGDLSKKHPMFPFGYNVHFVMDYKLDEPIHALRNYQILSQDDWVKFVIGSRRDFEKAKQAVEILREKECRARMAFSPVFEKLPGGKLGEWILDDKLWDITLNCQIHKYFGLM